jgi:GDPmannose 4,6-dehydratase
MFACNGILFNHESPRRGENFVTRKITLSIANILKGKQKRIYLGNLDAKRDWGFAPDYVEAMWLMLQRNAPEDFVIASGKNHTVREFVELAFKEVDINIEWNGKGINEKGINSNSGEILVEISPRYFRPTDVDNLLGDSTKAKEKLGWFPKTSFKQLVKIMINSDIKEA